MGYDLRWSESALDDLEAIFDYLQRQWSQREVDQFKQLLTGRLETIQKFPALFPLSHEKNQLRKSVISRQTSIFYQVDQKGEIISIIRLFDNRMDPKKLT